MTETDIRELIDAAQKAGYANNFAEAERICDEALYAIEGIRSTQESSAVLVHELTAKVLNIRSILRLITSDHAGAVEHATQAAEESRLGASREEEAMSLGTLGLVYNELADYPRALELYEDALRIGREIKHEPTIFRCLGNLGGVYFELYKYDAALTCFEEVLAYNERVNDPKAIAAGLSNVGSVHKEQGNSVRAIEYFRRALEINTTQGDDVYRSVNLLNIGLLYSQSKEYEQALQYFSESLAAAERSSFQLQIAASLMQIGNAHVRMDDNGELLPHALELLHRALDVATTISDLSSVSTIHFSLSVAYKKIGNHTLALDHHEQGHDIEKSIFGEEARKQGELFDHRRKIEASERDRQVKLARFQEQEKILHNILPAEIAERILNGEKTIADTYDEVSVFFSDIVGFTTMSQNTAPHNLVAMLNRLFSEFDRLAIKHGLEKIKTIGDAYMAVAGAPLRQADHARRAALFALDVVQFINESRVDTDLPIEIRIGLHSGHAVAGVIGESKFAYDLWGDAVNTASRMESHGAAGKIHVSETFAETIQRLQEPHDAFMLVERGRIDVKGKGEMKTFYLQTT